MRDVRHEIGLQLVEFRKPFERVGKFHRALADPILQPAVGSLQRRLQLGDHCWRGFVQVFRAFSTPIATRICPSRRVRLPSRLSVPWGSLAPAASCCGGDDFLGDEAVPQLGMSSSMLEGAAGGG